MIALWLMTSAAQPNFGFVPIDGSEAFGYNLGRALLFPGLGTLFLYKGWAKKHIEIEKK